MTARASYVSLGPPVTALIASVVSRLDIGSTPGALVTISTDGLTNPDGNRVMLPLDPTYSTRRWLKLGLTLTGVLAGAVFGVVLTRLGKIVSGAPPATLANYAWNAAVFAVLAGVVSPIVSWSALRRVPVWRTVVEPLGYAIAGGAAAVIAGPIGLGLGFLRLHRRYMEPSALPSPRPADETVR
jgi:hypothetical protein